MATKNENAEIAVLQEQIKTVQNELTDIKKIIKEVQDWIKILDSRYVTQDQFSEFKGRWFWSHSASGIFGGVLVGVTIYVLTQGIK